MGEKFFVLQEVFYEKQEKSKNVKVEGETLQLHVE
jgi:hypothetical protein